MNGRGLLLLLLTLGFVAIWQQDTAWKSTESASKQEEPVEKIADREDLQSWNSLERMKSVAGRFTRLQQFVLDYDLAYAPDFSTAVQTVAETSDMSDGVESGVDTEFVSLNDAGVPVPNGIARGEYRVVNNRGAVLRVRITDCDLAYGNIQEELPARDLYTSYNAGERWFFIRLVDTEPVLVQQFAPVDSVITKAETELTWSSLMASVVEKSREVQTRREQRLLTVRDRLKRLSGEMASSMGNVESRLEQWPALWSDWAQSVASEEAGEASPVKVSSDPTSKRPL